jgi:hypothetical protein
MPTSDLSRGVEARISARISTESAAHVYERAEAAVRQRRKSKAPGAN